MAIAEMKKITLLAMHKDKTKLMARMQQLGCVQVIEAERHNDGGEQLKNEKARLGEINKRIDRLDLAIKRLSPFDKHRQGMLDPRHLATEEQVASVLASKGETMAVVDLMEEIERTRGDLRSQEARNKALIDQLAPWEALTVPLDRLGNTRTSFLMLATMPKKNADAFYDAISKLSAVEVEEITVVAENRNMLIAVHQSERAQFDELMKEYGVIRVNFPDMTGTAPLMLDMLRSRLARIDEVRSQLSADVEKLADNLHVMRILRDIYALERDQLASSVNSDNTRTAFLLTGWVPYHRCNQVKLGLKKCVPLVEIEFSDPAKAETPPTMLRNNKIVSPFESIVKMFDAPSPAGIDPTLVMMPFWICFFGMMVSDAGYGIILGLICGYVFHKLGDRGIGKLAFILALGGLSAVFWGAMYGGWFGIEGIKPLLFAPMDEPLYVLILCLALGVVHLFAGLIVAAYMNFKRGMPLNALFDQFSWILLLVGLGLLAINQLVGFIVAGTGFLLIVLFAARDKENPISRIVGGLGNLYGITGYLSDVLSYARLFGLGLATGVIGMVVNMLAMMMWGSPIGCVIAVVILILGHTLNLLINTLGAYVHSCRFQYIEFFNKFFVGGGRNFAPLEQHTRYVDIAQGNNH